MTLPEMVHWDKTSRRLHQASRLLETVRLLALAPQPLYLHLALTVLPNGLSSGPLPGGGAFELDFVAACIRYSNTQGVATTWRLEEHTQASLLEAIVTALLADETVPLAGDQTDPVEALFATLAERKATPPREALTGTEVLVTDKATAAGYAAVQYAVFTGLARFRARLGGLTSPLVVWPHHFDLSGLWFPGKALDDWQPHLNFGFAPFSEGLPRPYLYAYAYPYPESFVQPALPAPIRWHTEGWQGAVLSYDDIPSQADLATFVENAAAQLFAALHPLLETSS
jgi:hypothetical protein